MPETRRFGDYDLHERLAVGGMGELYLASRPGEPVGSPRLVLKILISTYRENRDFVKMFEDEARIGMQLAHPNIVGVYEVGCVEDTPFIVLEYVDGENLRNVLRMCTERKERMPAELVIRVGVDVLLGLDHAHRAKDERGGPLNLVHRDLSPDNVMIGWDGDVKILDFGIAKASGRETETQFGVLKGKSQYMAPEQAEGVEVDARTDLFSLAIVILESITGEKRFPYDDPVKQILDARTWKAYGPSEVDKSLPIELDAILLKALQLDPARRWQSADEFAAALTRLLRGTALPRAGESLPVFMARIFKRRKVMSAPRLTDETTVPPDANRNVVRSTATGEARSSNVAGGNVVRTPSRVTPVRTELDPEPANSSEDETVIGPRARGRAAPAPTQWREEPQTADTRKARNLAGDDRPTTVPTRESELDDPTEEASVSLELPIPERTPMPPARPIGAVRLRSSAAIPDEALYTDATNPGEHTRVDTDVGSEAPDPSVRERRRGKEALSRPPRKKRGWLGRIFLVALLGGLAGASAAAVWEFRDRLPAGMRARVETAGSRVIADARVQNAIAAARARGILPADPLAIPTPEDLLVVTTGAQLAMASPVQSATVVPVVTPMMTPATTAIAIVSAIAVVTPVAEDTVAVVEPTTAATKKPRATAVPEATATTASVRITSEPSGFEILVDGKGTGRKTPATVQVPPGMHVVSIEADGFKVWSFQEELRAGDTLQLPAKLVPN